MAGYRSFIELINAHRVANQSTKTNSLAISIAWANDLPAPGIGGRFLEKLADRRELLFARRSADRSIGKADRPWICGSLQPATSGRARIERETSIMNGWFIRNRAWARRSFDRGAGWLSSDRGNRTCDKVPVDSGDRRSRRSSAGVRFRSSLASAARRCGRSSDRRLPVEHRAVASKSSRRRFARQYSVFSGSTCAGLRTIVALLLIGVRKHDPAMERLDRPASLGETRSEMVEELGVGRRFASQPEIARCRDQGCAEVVHPDAVHDRTSRQWVIPASDGPSQLKPAAAFAKWLSLGWSMQRQENAAARVDPGCWGCRVERRAARTVSASIFQAHGPRRGTRARGQPVLHGVPQLLAASPATGGRAEGPGHRRAA